MKITIEASDGKVFKGASYSDLEKEVNAYETDLKLKKQAELERQKKAEEEKKAKECSRQKSLKVIEEKLQELEKLKAEHEKIHNERLKYVYRIYGGLGIQTFDEYETFIKIMNLR